VKKQQNKAPRRKRIHPIHKRIALHASSLLIVFSAGFIPLPFGTFAETLSYEVSARVPAEPLTSPALITSPVDGQRFTTNTITVSGTCPDNSYVKVLRGTEVAGIAVCNANTFIMQISIAPGANMLTAKVFNITDDEGPASPPITVYYDVPVQPQNPTQPTTPIRPPQPTTPVPSGNGGLAIDVPYKYTIRKPNETWQWQLNVSGGTPPYTITVQWGDGTSGTYTRDAAGTFTITHAYGKADVYRVLIKAQDATGAMTLLEISAPVKDPLQANIGLLSLLQTLNPWIIWPLYAVLLLCVLLFWLYELRRMHRHLQRRKLRRRHG
jgi:hypothetical protein